ncbi:1757_t:CDS:2, partial [Racocetra fulgida]
MTLQNTRILFVKRPSGLFEPSETFKIVKAPVPSQNDLSNGQILIKNYYLSLDPGQIAKIKGARVIGIAGSPEKCAWIVDELGFDVALNYRDPDFHKQLIQATPNYIDVYFDNVGGDILNLCLKRIAKFARIVLCGAISQYNEVNYKGPGNYVTLIAQSDYIVEGLENAPQALLRLFKGENTGKMLIKIADENENIR